MIKNDNTKKRLPIGLQDFESLIKDGFLYVDKSEYIYKLAYGDGKAYFLSRPRRFGKSLFLSALKAYWEGKKELFKGLEIEALEKDNKYAWQTYPVFYFDFNKKNYKKDTALETVLNEHLCEWESEYNINNICNDLEGRFRVLIRGAFEKTGNRVVILVDEYDKPLLENGVDKEREESDKAVFKGFFSTLKSYDRYIKFSFFTGVTKFSKVSIFSDLNHLVDISIDKRYVGICGITQDELKDNLDGYVRLLAEDNEMTKEECYKELKRLYDGYHFYHNSVGVYNLYSVLNALAKREFGEWWFETGTPTFLVNRLKETSFDIKKLSDGSIYMSLSGIMDYREDNPDPVPLLFQTGYLTITSYDKELKFYQLSYPNDEVKYAFINSLAPMFLYFNSEPNPLDIREFVIDIRQGNTDGLRDRLRALYSSLPYVTDERPLEQNFQNVAYIVFTLLGQLVRTEVHSALGRSDVIVETDKYVYVMEFKRDGKAKDALMQIEKNGYAMPYSSDKRKVIKIGANFNSETRTLEEWIVESR